MKYLVALDLEGIHGVVGRPYEGLYKGTDEYIQATKNAEKEINALCEELFAQGETEVLLWDTHAATDNVDMSNIRGNVKRVDWRKYPYRLRFLKDCGCKGIFYLGFHARAGTLGVLAHTYSSKDVQYYKLNGKAVGEFEIDCMLAAQYGIAPYFTASDDVGAAQMQAFCPHITAVVTKIAKGRNSAECFSSERVLCEIKAGVQQALKTAHTPPTVQFPMTAEFRYTRLERACEVKANLESVLQNGVEFGEDCHVIKTVLENFQELEILLQGKKPY